MANSIVPLPHFVRRGTKNLKQNQLKWKMHAYMRETDLTNVNLGTAKDLGPYV